MKFISIFEENIKDTTQFKQIFESSSGLLRVLYCLVILAAIIWCFIPYLVFRGIVYHVWQFTKWINKKNNKEQKEVTEN